VKKLVKQVQVSPITAVCIYFTGAVVFIVLGNFISPYMFIGFVPLVVYLFISTREG